MAQIFLSYSRQDSDTAQTLAQALGDSGHSVWWDRHISGGSKFAAEIEQALDSADVVVVLWSQASIASSWVLDEAAEGRDSGRLLPLALDDCRPPLGFRQYQTVPAPKARLAQAIDEILKAIARRSDSPDGEQARETDPVKQHCSAAHRLGDQGEFEKAWEQVEAAMAVDPLSGEANQEAGRLLFLQGRTKAAIPYYERAVATLPRDHESAAMLVSCHHAANDAQAVRNAAELALARAELEIASGRETGSAFASGAKALSALGHPDRARKWIRKALNTEPGNLRMRYALASAIAQFLEDGEAALDVLEPVIEGASSRGEVQLLTCDPAWDAVRETGAFRSLVARARKRVEAIEATAPLSATNAH